MDFETWAYLVNGFQSLAFLAIVFWMIRVNRKFKNLRVAGSDGRLYAVQVVE